MAKKQSPFDFHFQSMDGVAIYNPGGKPHTVRGVMCTLALNKKASAGPEKLRLLALGQKIMEIQTARDLSPQERVELLHEAEQHSSNLEYGKVAELLDIKDTIEPGAQE